MMTKWFLRKIGLGDVQCVPMTEQSSRTWRLILLDTAAALAGIAGVLVLSDITHKPMLYMTRDPAAITDTDFYIGFLSNIGIMLWAATAAVCLFAAIVLRRWRRQRQSLFLFASGLLSLILLLDDTFMLHEEVMQRYFHTPQLAVYAGYAILVPGYLAFFARDILKTDYLLLVIALSFLGLSMGMDAILPFSDFETIVEDGMKFAGIVFWISYYVHTASGMVQRGAAGTQPVAGG